MISVYVGIDGERPSVAFCSDPFGHGFCVLERKSGLGDQ